MPFKTYFDKTQKELRDKFGMEMCELPTKEKITMKEKLGNLIYTQEIHIC